MSTIHPGLSIPELIKFIRHSFRESEFDELQNTLLERENIMQTEMENLVKERDSLKKELENTQNIMVLERSSMAEKLAGSEKRCEQLAKENVRLREKSKMTYNKCEYMDERLAKMEGTHILTVLEKSILEEKLGRSQKRCAELDEETVRLNEQIGILMSEKLCIEEKLETSHEKCEEMEVGFAKMENEMEEKLSKMEKEIEELRCDKLNAHQTIKGLKLKEIETNRFVQEREAYQIIHELKVKKMEYDKTAGVDKSSCSGLDARILMLEKILAEKLNMNVEDVRYLVCGMKDLAEVSVLPPTSGLGGKVSCSAAEKVVVVSDSDSDDEAEAG